MHAFLEEDKAKLIADEANKGVIVVELKKQVDVVDVAVSTYQEAEDFKEINIDSFMHGFHWVEYGMIQSYA